MKLRVRRVVDRHGGGSKPIQPGPGRYQAAKVPFAKEASPSPGRAVCDGKWARG